MGPSETEVERACFSYGFKNKHVGHQIQSQHVLWRERTSVVLLCFCLPADCNPSLCFRLQSDVTTRVQLCFGHCKRCKKCVFLRACHVNCLWGLGWLEDCLAQCKRCQMCVFLHACHINCHVGLGWGGGWGVMTSLNLHAWLMLRHPWGWGVGWDVITFVAHEHMLNATQQLRFLLGC